ncbi:LysR family transcriptional regulator [Pullulanibacillus sp. KACC 23026]|uniref:LysR family transcriptional regulator n=1 Tax=Pullulanibacillus sp. KACC 23026 TaxID=3028315 RepID=UPI0023B1DC48|nr:LysR family transcriptional regulator [Pullulanibacillus sp. KACC 23026]WEG13741.1 LysR family transcriptional regulator [Pullulanibacillus sp. KACC 23026]
MELRQILYFIEVAKREHVTEAAQSLHVAQSAVSRQISLLEAELEVPLFNREGRNVKLTQIGKVFLEHVEKAVAELDIAKEKIEDYLNPELGVVRLGFATSLSIHTLPIVLSQFRSDYPDVAFQLHQGSTRYLIDSIEKGELDIAFAAPVPLNHESIEGTIFYMEKLWAILPVHHPLAESSSIRLSDLRREAFVSFRPGLPLHESVKEACSAAGFQPKFTFEGEDMDTIKALVASGFGVALIPEQSALELSHELVRKPISEPEVSRPVGIMVPRTRELAPSEKLLYRYLRNFYNRLDRFGQ